MKPGDFLLGVLDFFAILLPGGIATWLALQYIPHAMLRDAMMFGFEGPNINPDRLVLIAAFLLASYMLGHFVFMAGSFLDPSYDRWRKRSKPQDPDVTFQAARKLHAAINKELTGGELTTLKWAKAYIQVKASQARIEIDRLEADQKFFRSLVVIFTACAAHFLLGRRAVVAGLAAIVLAVLSYHRYRDQRWKMTELIFATAVIAHAVGERGVPAPIPDGEVA